VLWVSSLPRFSAVTAGPACELRPPHTSAVHLVAYPFVSAHYANSAHQLQPRHSLTTRPPITKPAANMSDRLTRYETPPFRALQNYVLTAPVLPLSTATR
jgi:hypothetical protein